jgi:hypothetical protein
MRFALLAATLSLTGCASTVYRLSGEPTTPGGPARTECESKDWLVVAPTRAEIADTKKGTSHPVNGLGLYRIGSSSPESIPSLDLRSPSVEQKREELASYEQRQIIAGALGAAGVAAIAIGTVLFVNAFNSQKTVDSMGVTHEDDSIDGTQAGIGGAVVGLGFGLGIAGLVVGPSHAERTRANATRHVFLDPPDDAKSVDALVEQHNASVRQTCAGAR